MIAIRNLTVRFGDNVVFDDYNADIPDEGVVLLMGKSGIGKTTLLRVLAGLLKPDKGSIKGLKGRRISVAFQESRLLEWKTALENVSLVSSKETAYDLLSQLAMDRECGAKAKTLSGGQKQRVSIARAFAFSQDVILLDEPFTGLDDENKARVATLIAKAKLALVITHDPSDAALLHTNKKITL